MIRAQYTCDICHAEAESNSYAGKPDGWTVVSIDLQIMTTDTPAAVEDRTSHRLDLCRPCYEVLKTRRGMFGGYSPEAIESILDAWWPDRLKS